MKNIYTQFFNKKLFTKSKKLNDLIENLFDLIDEDDFISVYQSQVEKLSKMSVQDIMQRFVLAVTRNCPSVKSINQNVSIKFLLVHNFQNMEDEDFPKNNTLFDFIFDNQKIHISNLDEQFTLEVYRKISSTKFEEEASIRIVANLLNKVEISLYSNTNFGTLKNIMSEFDIDEQAQGIA